LRLSLTTQSGPLVTSSEAVIKRPLHMPAEAWKFLPIGPRTIDLQLEM
jgi:hypothetical protein